MSDDSQTQHPTRQRKDDLSNDVPDSAHYVTPGGAPSRPIRARDAANDCGRISEAPQLQFSTGVVISDRYRVEKSLGHGGMAEVYEVTDMLKNEKRALKIMRKELSVSEEDRIRFLKESNAAKLHHPHIVQTIDIGEWKEKKLLFITMELVQGFSLRTLMQEYRKQGRRIPLKQALSIGYQVCKALEYAHAEGFIHCDIKPDNVVVRDDGGITRAWVTDFGIARLKSDSTTSPAAGVLGTPAYMAPEQRESSGRTSALVDVYSLGVTLYELICGQLPVNVEERPVELQELPEEVATVLCLAMEKNVARRTESVAILRGQIGKLLADSGYLLADVFCHTHQFEPLNSSELVFELLPPRTPLTGMQQIPEHIRLLDGSLQQLREAISLIEAGTHPLMIRYAELLKGHSEKCDLLEKRLEQSRPKNLSNATEGKMWQMIKNGTTKPSEFLRACEGEKDSEVLEFAQGLMSLLEHQTQRAVFEEEFTRNKTTELERLKCEEQSVAQQLKEARLQDLQQSVSDFLARYQNTTRFPYAEWGQFLEKILDSRRYGMSALEMTAVADAMFSERQKNQGNGEILVAKSQDDASHHDRRWSIVLFTFAAVLLLLTLMVFLESR
ncbi:MAG: serine/threonine protein kinase [Planctomycetaceae bacterium]|nr:serine/threonine protein kinase [Planctomycetaceae bacterium]